MTVRLRHLAEINPPIPGWEQIPDDRLLTFVPLDAVWPRQIDFTQERPKSQTSTGYTRFMNGDVIVPKITPTFEADRSTWVNGSPTAVLTGTTELHVVRPGPRLEPRYLDHVFSSHPFLQDGASQMVGVAGQKRISDEWLRNYRVPMIGLETQRKIADYLDTETARIDALISKKCQLIQLLEERKSLLAEEAIAILRGSARLVPLKYLVDESDRRYRAGSKPTMLSVSIHRGVIPRDALLGAGSRADDLSRYKQCEPGDLVVNRMRAFQGGVGVVGQTGVVSPDYTVLRIGRRVSPKYLHYVMRSSWFVSEMTRRLRGIGATDQGQVRTPRINFADLGLIGVPVPSRKRQDHLSSSLVSQEASLTQAVDVQTKQTALLAERRQALITAIVTGTLPAPRVVVGVPLQRASRASDLDNSQCRCQRGLDCAP